MRNRVLRHRNVSRNDRATYTYELRRLVTKKAERLCANEQSPRDSNLFFPVAHKADMTNRIVFFSLIMLASSASSASAESRFVVDRAHTTASFSVSHLTLTTVAGSVAIKEITLDGIGPDRLPTSIAADFDLKTIDTREADRDNDLRSDHWFDTAKYPDMIFKSSKITGDAKAMTIAGDLTYHGVTKPVTLAGTYVGSIVDGKGRTHVGYNATTTFDRTQWGLGTGFPSAIVGNDITVKIDVEAVQTP